jgi:glycosyltransferase involved in cell wall biosynthesis
MKRLWFVAPGAMPPWTEGRKNFVRDVAIELESRGDHADIINGASMPPRTYPIVPPTLAALASAYAELHERLKSNCRPDAVVAFPFGTFHGGRGYVNRLFTARALKLCRDKGIQSTALLYSCVGANLSDIPRWFGPSLSIGRGAMGVIPVRLGIHHAEVKWTSPKNPKPRLLFMAGYQDVSRRSLDLVLHERGLFDLLSVGNQIADMGASLAVAIPLLQDECRKQDLQKIARELCPALDLSMLSSIDYSKDLLAYDGFIFPYRSSHAAFVPTSLIETMSLGIPVVTADHRMYADLTRGRGRERCLLYPPGSLSALVEKIKQLVSDPSQSARLAQETRDFVREEWTLRHSVDGIFRHLFNR